MTNPVGTTPTPALKSLLEVWPALLALVYIAGYLVVNSHFARYEFTKSELLSGRYVSAGILFLAIGLVPIMLSFFALRLVLLDHSDEAEWLKASGLLVSAAAVYAFLIHKVTLLETPWDLRYWGLYLLLMATSAFLALATILLQAQENRAIAPKWTRRFVGIRNFAVTSTGRVVALMAATIGGLILFGFGASRFGTIIYPSIFPEYSGGAAVLVDIALKNDASDEAKAIASRGLLPRIDQDDDFLYVIVCRAGTQPDKVYALQLSEVEIVSMKVSTNERAVVDVPAYLRQTCGVPSPASP